MNERSQYRYQSSDGAWRVELHPALHPWVAALSEDDAKHLEAAAGVLGRVGPTLGRPLVDSIVGRRHRNMKELRPGSSGETEIRVLFAFDRVRRAILLVGGDKSGEWSEWYERNIPIADSRFDEHQASLDVSAPKQKRRRKR